MKKIFYYALFLTLFISNIFAQNPPAYEQRRADFVDSMLANFVPNAITLQAYDSVAIDQPSLDVIYDQMLTRSTIDFKIVQLIRVLFLTDGSYDTQILNELNKVPYWYNHSDTLRGYWSENHMIMWMSSDWLLKESYGKMTDPYLRDRLEHYLDLKIKYGFYEFFSSTYMTYCLSGLLNLADFSQDLIIKNKAELAAQRLLKELLMLTNTEGVFYPAAGRNYFGKYDNPYQQNHFNLIYLLTGIGTMPDEVSHSGGFLASSTIDVTPVINSWRAEIDTLYSVGHSIDSVRIIHQNQRKVDRIMFQWSSGCYFHPDFAYESTKLLVDSNTWGHVDFEQLNILSGVGPALAEDLAGQLTSISKSSVIADADIRIFKNNTVSLASIQDFWKGKLGYQQFPIAANIRNTAVFPASGAVEPNWSDGPSSNMNDHLPYVEQDKNVALVMYRGEAKIEIFGKTIPDVALHMFEQDFDQVDKKGLWILGKNQDSYVAVRRYCEGEKNGWYTCDIRAGQAWVVIVGNDSMYGNYNNFSSLVDSAEFEDDWYQDSSTSEWVYYASINFDNTFIDYEWKDSVRYTSVEEEIVSEKMTFKVFPNPAQNQFTIELENPSQDEIQITVYDALGREKAFIPNVEGNRTAINSSKWSKGLYFIRLSNPDGTINATEKIIITQ